MPAPFRRGDVVRSRTPACDVARSRTPACDVLRAGRYSVVWEVRRTALVVLPILVPRRPDGADVALDLADLAACGVPVAGAVVRPASMRIERPDAVLAGALPAMTLARVAHGLSRALADARARSHDDYARRMRAHADDRCVDLLR